jgi:hypothetical protein
MVNGACATAAALQSISNPIAARFIINVASTP